MFVIKMWLWQAAGPQTGTGADETFAPGHCLPHLPLAKNEVRRLSCLTTINLCPIQVETLALMGVCSLQTLSKQINLLPGRQHQSDAG